MLPLTYFPDATVKHSDWEVAAIARLTFAAGFAGAGGLFSFRNGNYAKDPVYGGLTYDMLFVGGGGGLDVVARMSGRSEALKSKASGLFAKWHKLECDQPFSAVDLSGSSGRITSLTLGLYDVVLVSAGNMSGSLFHGQSVGGFGLGLGGAVTIGAWIYAF